MKEKKEMTLVVQTEESEELKALREEENLRIAEEYRKNIAQGNADLTCFLGTDDREMAKKELKNVEEAFVGRLLCFVSFNERMVVGRIRRAMLMVSDCFSLYYVLEMEERENGKAVMYSFTLPEAAALYKHRYLKKTSEPYEGKRYEVIRIEEGEE